MPTHEVLNQPPALHDYDRLAQDRALLEAIRREGAEWAEDDIADLGRRAASREVLAWGVQANENPPRLRTHGLGVGLPVIAAIAESLEIGTPEGGGTEVRMRFALAGKDG